MNEDIYKPSESSLEKNSEGINKTKMYSPTQAALGTIGGPVGVVYFIMANYEALGQVDKKQKTLFWGVVFIVALAIVLPFLPEDIPSGPFTLFYILIAYNVANNYQMSKAAIIESNAHDFHSNWRVLGMGLLCLVASLVILLTSAIGVIYLSGGL